MAQDTIIEQAFDALAEAFPAGGTDLIERRQIPHAGAGLIVKIMGKEYVCFERNSVTKATMNTTLAMLQSAKVTPKQQVLLVAQYVAPQVANELAENGVNYLDIVGNCYIRYMHDGRVVFLISRQGRKRKEAATKPYPVFQEAGLKVIFYLLQSSGNVRLPYREMASQTKVSLGSIKNVVYELTKRGFVDETNNGRILRNKPKLLDLWVNHYNEVLKPKLLMGQMSFRTEDKRNEWRGMQLPQGMCWGGEPAANILDGYLQPGSFDIYSDIPMAHLMRTRAVKQENGGEIQVYKKFWNGKDDGTTVPPLLVYADLMGSGNSRCLEAAQRLLKNELEDFE
jgi:hypothetical protein